MKPKFEDLPAKDKALFYVTMSISAVFIGILYVSDGGFF